MNDLDDVVNYPWHLYRPGRGCTPMAEAPAVPTPMEDPGVVDSRVAPQRPNPSPSDEEVTTHRAKDCPVPR